MPLGLVLVALRGDTGTLYSLNLENSTLIPSRACMARTACSWVQLALTCALGETCFFLPGAPSSGWKGVCNLLLWQAELALTWPRAHTCLCAPHLLPKVALALMERRRSSPAPGGRRWWSSISGAPQHGLVSGRLCREPLVMVKAIATGALGRNGGLDGACEPHMSLTHESELNRDGNARQGHRNALRVLPTGCWSSLGGLCKCSGGSPVLLRSPLPRYGGAAWSSGVLGGSTVCPEHSAEHVFPGERQRVPSSRRVTLQGMAACWKGSTAGGGRRGPLISSPPFLAVI